MSNLNRPKSSKTKLGEEYTEEPLDLSHKRKRTLDNETKWGILNFHESDKLVISKDLNKVDWIKINAESFLPGQSLDDNHNYTDWEHVLGDGFQIRYRTINNKNIVEFKNLDDSVNYKVFVGDKDYKICSLGNIEVYNSGNELVGLDQVKTIKEAYEFKKNLNIIVTVWGGYMGPMGRFLKMDTFNKDLLGSFPYWFLIKLNSQYTLLDKHIKNKLNLN